jgi:hypothetical protein
MRAIDVNAWILTSRHEWCNLGFLAATHCILDNYNLQLHHLQHTVTVAVDPPSSSQAYHSLLQSTPHLAVHCRPESGSSQQAEGFECVRIHLMLGLQGEEEGNIGHQLPQT